MAFPWDINGDVPEHIEHLVKPTNKVISKIRLDGKTKLVPPKPSAHIVIHKPDVRAAMKRKASI